MATAALPETLGPLTTNATILKAVTDAVESCFAMCDIQSRCVGVATIPAHEPGAITGMIGVHGNVSGFITVNLAERVARVAVSGLLQETISGLTNQVVDGVGEITNIIGGGVKKGLVGTPWAFGQVTVPSVIVGQNYQIAFTRGLEYLNVTFEHIDQEAVLLGDRLIQVAVSLIRL